MKGGRAFEEDAVAVMDNLARLYRLQDASTQLRPKNAGPDKLGMHHVRMEQLHEGLRVFGGDLIAHFNMKGDAYMVNGQFAPTIGLDVTPRVAAAAAVDAALADLAEISKLPFGVGGAALAGHLCVHGYDFINNDGNPMDDHYHGTHVAGTIGAEGNNGIGVAGLCWRVKIMALKFLDSGGYGDTADAITAVEYATLMGARLTSNSWGGGPYEQAMKDAIDAAAPPASSSSPRPVTITATTTIPTPCTRPATSRPTWWR